MKQPSLEQLHRERISPYYFKYTEYIRNQTGCRCKIKHFIEDFMPIGQDVLAQMKEHGLVGIDGEDVFLP